MKTISLKAAMLCAGAALPLAAHAQDGSPNTPPWMASESSGPAMSSDGFVVPEVAQPREQYEAPPIERWEPSEDDEPTVRGRVEEEGENARPVRQALPPPGTEVSMSGYDQMLEGLNKDIDARLNQLSLDGGAEATTGIALPTPSVGSYQSTLEQLSADQREIKLLESKLEKAQLAKQVWAELYTDDRDALAEQVTALEAANAELVSASQAREADLYAQREADQARLMELEFELEMARAEQEAAVAEAEARAESDGFGEATGSRPGTLTIPMPESSPRVEAITIVGGRRAARLSLIEGSLRTVGVGDDLGAEHGVVASIDASGVQMKLPDGTVKTLKRGTFRNLQTTAEFPDLGGDFGDMPGYLDDAAEFAN